MRPVPEREAAKAAGERFYFTGKPCKNGHIGKRYAANGLCAVCAIANTTKSAAKRPENPARILARIAGETIYLTGKPCKNGHDAPRFVCNDRCVKCDAGAQVRYHKKNPGIGAKWARTRRAKDPTPHREGVKRWYYANKEAAQDIARRWKKANPERWRLLQRASTERRRAKIAENGGTFTIADIEALFERQNGICATPGCSSSDRLEIDHVLPVILGGSSDPSNLQLLCLPCNRAKGSKHPDDWIKLLNHSTFCV